MAGEFICFRFLKFQEKYPLFSSPRKKGCSLAGLNHKQKKESGWNRLPSLQQKQGCTWKV